MSSLPGLGCLSLTMAQALEITWGICAPRGFLGSTPDTTPTPPIQGPGGEALACVLLTTPQMILTYRRPQKHCGSSSPCWGLCSSGSTLYVCGVLQEGPVGAFPAQRPSASSRRVPCHLPGHSAQIRSCRHLPECSLMACHFHFQPVRQSFWATGNGCEPPRIT